MSNPIVTNPTDPRLARVWPLNAAGFEQSRGEPTYLVIGPNAPRAKVESLAERLGLSADHLLSFSALESRQEVA